MTSWTHHFRPRGLTTNNVKSPCGHRTKFVYNNALYALAGELIASFVGKSFAELVKEFMLEIGMVNSTVIDESGSYEDLPNMSQAYYIRDGAVHKMNRTLLKRVSIVSGAGAILSTSTDMGKYMEFHSNKGKVGDKQIVSGIAMSWLRKASIHTLEIPSKPNANGPTHSYYAYELGFALSLYDGYATYGHSGSWPPFHSDIKFYEYDGKIISVFLTINGPGFIGAPKALTHGVVSGVIFDIIRTGNYNRNLTRTPEELAISKENVTKEEFQTMTTDSYTDTTENDNFDTSTEIPILGSTEGPTYKAMDIEIENNSLTQNFDNIIGLYGNDSAGDLIVKLDTEDPSYLQFNFGEWGIGRLLPMSGSDTKYLVKWKTDIVQYWYTLTSFGSVLATDPIFHIDFNPLNGTLDLSVNYVHTLTFLKNASVDTFPIVPWDQSSCGPL